MSSRRWCFAAAGQPGHHGAVIGQLAVGLVGDEVDNCAKLAALGLKQCAELFEHVGGVDDACGIVGVIEYHGLGLRRNGRADGVKVGHEALFGRCGDDHYLGVRIADVVVVLEEVRGYDDDLVSGVAEHAEDDVQPAGAPTVMMMLPAL